MLCDINGSDIIISRCFFRCSVTCSGDVKKDLTT